MPGVECFLDTNVLVYAVSTIPAEAAESAVARQLLDSKDWAWSVQVAAEFINVSTSRKRLARLSLLETEFWIDTWLAFPMARIDEHTVKEALRTAAQAQISYFDAQIIAAARQMGCGTLYTEDLNHGQDYSGVRVLNPFRGV